MCVRKSGPDVLQSIRVCFIRVWNQRAGLKLGPIEVMDRNGEVYKYTRDKEIL